MNTTTVVIGDHTQGLGIVRSAAAAGGRVWVVHDRSLSLARCSKHLSGFRRLERGTLGRLGTSRGDEELLDAILDLPVEYPALLFGVNDDIVAFIQRHASRLTRKYVVPAVRVDAICDKYAFNSLLPESARLDTRLCSDIDLRAVQNAQRYIVKGRRGNAFRRLTGEKAIVLDRFVRDYERHVFKHLPPDQALVQEIIETDHSVSSLCSFCVNGRPAGLFAYDKLTQHPNQFGTGTYLRSVDAEPLAPLAEEVLRRTAFTGISEIEFIRDRRTGTFRIIEMNPRTWKSIHFATRCGQNLVAQYLRYIATGAIERDERYDRGRDWVDLATDIPQIIRQRKLSPYRRGFFECTWDPTDPWPAVVLWTLFPLIALEEWAASFAAANAARRRVEDVCLQMRF